MGVRGWEGDKEGVGVRGKVKTGKSDDKREMDGSRGIPIEC